MAGAAQPEDPPDRQSARAGRRGGIREATITHHLNAMATDGLLTRRRDHNNRRIHVVELTDAGEAAFLRLRDAAVAFDRRLRRGITAAGLASLEDLLGRLAANVEPREDGSTPSAGLIETERRQHSATANAPSPEIPKQSLATEALTAAASILVDRDPPGAGNAGRCPRAVVQDTAHHGRSQVPKSRPRRAVMRSSETGHVLSRPTGVDCGCAVDPRRLGLPRPGLSAG